MIGRIAWLLQLMGALLLLVAPGAIVIPGRATAVGSGANPAADSNTPYKAKGG